jgi:hypothetical protein
LESRVASQLHDDEDDAAGFTCLGFFLFTEPSTAVSELAVAKSNRSINNMSATLIFGSTKIISAHGAYQIIKLQTTITLKEKQNGRASQLLALILSADLCFQTRQMDQIMAISLRQQSASSFGDDELSMSAIFSVGTMN